MFIVADRVHQKVINIDYDIFDVMKDCVHQSLKACRENEGINLIIGILGAQMLTMYDVRGILLDYSFLFDIDHLGDTVLQVFHPVSWLN